MSISRVQTATATSAATTVTTLSVVFGSAPTAGNLLVLVVGTNARSPVATSDSTVSWVKAQQEGAAGTMHTVFLGRVFSGASATVTLTLDTSGPMAIAGAEYSGVDGAVDRMAEATNTSSAPDSGATATTSSASQLWLGAITSRLTGGGTFSAATGGFSIAAQATTTTGGSADRAVCLLDQVASSAGTPDAGATASGSGVWVAQTITLAAPAGGGGNGVSRSRAFGGAL